MWFTELGTFTYSLFLHGHHIKVAPSAVYNISSFNVKYFVPAKLINKLQHAEKARDPMLTTESGIVTFVSDLQPQKAPSSMLVKESGRATLVKDLQPSKARYPILVTASEMTTSPLFDLGHHITFLRFAVYKIPSLITKCSVLSN